jgi:hypothetical protein
MHHFLLKFFTALAFLGVFTYVLYIGVQRNEVQECLEWEQQAKDFAHFYATSWQVEQCKAHGITL